MAIQQIENGNSGAEAASIIYENDLLCSGQALQAQGVASNVKKRLDQITEGADQLADPANFRSGGYRLSDGTVAESLNLLRLLPFDRDPSQSVISVGGAGGIASAQARFAFWDAAGAALSTTQAETNVPIPDGTVKIGLTVVNATNAGADPENTPYKNTLMVNYGPAPLPYQPFEATVIGEKVIGQPPASSERDAAAEARIADLEAAFDIQYKFGTSAVYNLDTPLTLSEVGDYLEFSARIETLTGNNVLRMFGTPPTGQNAFGFYTNIFRLRGNVLNEPWTEFTEVPSFGNFHRYRLEVGAGNTWLLYVDGVLSSTRPKASDFVIGNIGNAYTPTLPFWLNGQTKIKSGDILLTLNSYDGSGAEKEMNLDPSNTGVNYSPVYVTVNPTGSSGAYELIQVFTRVKDKQYAGFRIYHYVTPATRYNYFRINTAGLYEFNGETMTLIAADLLTNGESEFTLQLDGKASHTGGAHGYEELDIVEFRADGIPYSVAQAVTLAPFNSFEYSVASKILDAPNLNGQPNTEAPLFKHFKHTVFGDGFGYVTTNEIEAVVDVPNFRYMYTGIFCIGRSFATLLTDDRLNSAVLGVSTGQKLENTGNDALFFSNAATGRAVRAWSNMLEGSDKVPRMWGQDRIELKDTKYYRISNGSGAYLVLAGQRLRSRSFLKIF